MKKILQIIVIVLLTSCATKEFQTAKQSCSPSAYQEYPVSNVQTMVTRYRNIQVPSGTMNCQSTPNGNGGVNTTCVPQMRTESIPYQSLELVDQNAQAREVSIKACAQQLCFQQFGNSDCKQ